MAKLVYGVSTRDPITFCLVPMAFLGCALLASYIPARKATRVDIREALKS